MCAIVGFLHDTGTVLQDWTMLNACMCLSRASNKAVNRYIYIEHEKSHSHHQLPRGGEGTHQSVREFTGRRSFQING